MSDHAALIEEARIGTGGYSESELRWLGKQLADALEAAEARNTGLRQQLDAIRAYVAEPADDWVCRQIRMYLHGKPSDIDYARGQK